MLTFNLHTHEMTWMHILPTHLWALKCFFSYLKFTCEHFSIKVILMWRCFFRRVDFNEAVRLLEFVYWQLLRELFTVWFCDFIINRATPEQRLWKIYYHNNDSIRGKKIWISNKVYFWFNAYVKILLC